ncbi:MAG: FAD-binding protein, partial [Clostridia bacterium]|nr:FAD-binding protein [Clostridia bacterium]
PTGAAYPEQILGALVTEKVRGLGAKLVNADGEVFMHPLETRDVAAAAVIRECSERGKGIDIPGGGQAVWLDTPMIEAIHGEGTIVSKIPGMFKMFNKYGIDMRKEPILIYPTLHYQNGGIEINEKCEVANTKNLYAAGEVVGGIHGRNRLMGNSLLDVIVFGRESGRQAAARAKEVDHVGKLNMDHVAEFEKELADAWVDTGVVSPKLFPSYKANFRTYLDTSFSSDKEDEQ